MRSCGFVLLLALAACALPPPAASPREARPSSPHPIEIAGQPANERALLGRAFAADVVYLGEKHDNPVHHELQARLLQALIGRGARPRLILEMVDEDRQVVLDTLAGRTFASPEEQLAAYRHELAWDHSGWPDFALYAPLFKAALAAQLPIVAGNTPRATIKRTAGMGAPLTDAERNALGLDSTLPADAEAALRQELAASHCGLLPEAALAPMAEAQRARDFTLAKHARVHAGAAPGPRSVVIAGAGHVRTDRGAPRYVHRAAPNLVQFALAFTERSQPHTAAPFFDARWWTPSANADEDHCAKMKSQMRR